MKSPKGSHAQYVFTCNPSVVGDALGDSFDEFRRLQAMLLQYEFCCLSVVWG